MFCLLLSPLFHSSIILLFLTDLLFINPSVFAISILLPPPLLSFSPPLMILLHFLSPSFSLVLHTHPSSCLCHPLTFLTVCPPSSPTVIFLFPFHSPPLSPPSIPPLLSPPFLSPCRTSAPRSSPSRSWSSGRSLTKSAASSSSRQALRSRRWWRSWPARRTNATRGCSSSRKPCSLCK